MVSQAIRPDTGKGPGGSQPHGLSHCTCPATADRLWAGVPPATSMLAAKAPPGSALWAARTSGLPAGLCALQVTEGKCFTHRKPSEVSLQSLSRTTQSVLFLPFLQHTCCGRNSSSSRGESASILSLQVMRLLVRNSGLSHGSKLLYVTTETLFSKVFHEAWDVLSILPLSQSR